MVRRLVAIVLLVSGGASAQQLDRTCLPGNDLANGLALEVDAFGTVHFSRVARVSGNLLYTRVDHDGVAVDELVDERVSVLGLDEVTDTGLLADADDTLVCYYSASDKRFKVATRAADGTWTREVLATGDRVGTGCDLVRYKGDPVVAWNEAGTLRFATRRAGVWQAVVVDDAVGLDVGHWPAIATGPDNAIAIAHYDANNENLRISHLDGVWQSVSVNAAAIGTGWRPTAFYTGAGELFVYHGGVPTQPDVGADVLLFETHGVPGAAFASGQMQGVNVAGSLDATQSGGLQTVFVRQRQRSALFGSRDALRMHRGPTGDVLQLTILEQFGAADRRHGYNFLQVAHDPFHLPVLAFLDDADRFFNQPASAQLCLYRPRDSDGDALPDEVEARLGTLPDNPDTDDDGRSDGEEVLIDGTDPVGDCEAVPETCDGADEDCDGAVDEDLARDCYPGAPGTRDVGLCRAGAETCVEGVFGACQGAVVPTDEVCDGRDEDCDDAVDEGNPGGGAPCDTELLGVCAEGVVTCQGARLECVQAREAGAEVCNLEDDDCDGEVDEGSVECGLGVCRRSAPLCVDGEDNPCVPFESPGPDVDCDDEDEDCDGAVDEDFPVEATACGVGGCGRAGELQCVVGQLVDTCVVGEPGADDRLCDSVDEDCDGVADEDFPQGEISCGIGECRRPGIGQCVDGQQVGDCTPGEPQAEGAACDGLDQDCDGRADEDFQPALVECGVGACVAEGRTTCVGSVLGDDCAPRAPGPNDAACDGVDEDCDGAADEDYVGRAVVCGEGACVADGITVCREGAEADDCTPLEPAADDPSCDGVDDDCDGVADEDYVAEPVACGVGACAAAGETRCEAGEVVDDCVGGEGAGADADCDGVDQDCDGAADEGFAPVPTECGSGACAAAGERRCVNAELVDSCQPGIGAANDDTCDGVDDDCDGAADEDFAPRPSACGRGACAAVGEARCVRGEVVDTCDAGEPALGDRSCDARDDDCDGEVDEDFRVRRTFCGLGACAALGETRCEGAQVVDTCEPADAAAADDATCDGVDDDCDGVADEDYVAPPTECGVGACVRDGLAVCERGRVRDTCDPAPAAADDRACDGVDSDCDGAADEDYAPQETACGVGACGSVGETFCEAGQVGDACEPGVPADGDGQCDGVDDDCDGLADEGYPVADTECGVGACAAVGVRLCRAGEEVDTCDAAAAGPDDRVCDGVDSDCDGAADEDFVVQATACGVGACEAVGETFCADGAAGDTCEPGAPAADDATCDAVDDDCDGDDDEDHQRVVTDCGDGACRAQGERVCVLGEELDSCVPLDDRAADDATCDGRDDDCDGTADEDYVATPTACGEGACARAGEVVCDDGAPRDTCRPRQAALQDATCDGVDDDCDDVTDEDYQQRGVDCGLGVCASQGVSSCGEGVETNDCEPGEAQGNDADCNVVDEDCDGAVDEDFPVEASECGVGDCVALGEVRCEDGTVRDTCEVGAAALTDASCDGRDDDCDGAADEDYQVAATECGVGVCAAVGSLDCVEGVEDDSCAAGEARGEDLSCDREDDDCDGVVDEAFPVRGSACGVGACASQGETVCELGRQRDTCEPGDAALTDATCDGVDDDCDGFTDEDFQARNVSCGVGACFREGEVTCEAGVETDSCAPGEAAVGDASCDEVDDDCDGAVDEDFEVRATACGAGVCAAVGELRCVNGAEADSCRVGAAEGADEDCDGVDEDCDGVADEGYELRVERCGVGACRAAGAVSCVDGVEVSECVPGTPAEDDATCDGVDDDCDDARDEDYVAQDITCGVGVCFAFGTRLCVAGVETDDCDAQPAAEADPTCDGADDDCDGVVDEDFTGEIRCGVGACEVVGAQRCVEGERVDDCTPGAPTEDDTCDGLDDDCDGASDEAYTPQGVSCGVGACVSVGVGQCEAGVVVSDCVPGPPGEADATCDGLDDDCDGASDEDYVGEATRCGVGACAREAALECIDGEAVDPCQPGTPALVDLACDGVDEDCDDIIDEECDPAFMPDAGLDPDDGVPADAGLDPDDGVPPPDAFIDPDDGVPPPDAFIDPDDGIPPPDAFVDPDDGVPPPDGGPDAVVGGDAGPDAVTPPDAADLDPDAKTPDARTADAVPDSAADACVGAECPERPRVRKPVPDDPLNCSCDATRDGSAPSLWLLTLLALRRKRRRGQPA